MDNMEVNKEKIAQLIELAKTGQTNPDIDWTKVSDELYITIAVNVLNQIDSVSEKDRETVMQSLLVKLLVENFLLKSIQNDNITTQGKRG